MHAGSGSAVSHNGADPCVRVHGTARSKPAARIPRWYWSRSGERCVFLNPAALAPTLRYSTARQSTALLLGHYLHYSMSVGALLRCALERACLYVVCTLFGIRGTEGRERNDAFVTTSLLFFVLPSKRLYREMRRFGLLYYIYILYSRNYRWN